LGGGSVDDRTLLELTSDNGVPFVGSLVVNPTVDRFRFRNENVGLRVFAGGGVKRGGGDDGGVDKSSSSWVTSE
jgi:hypothetical protein